MAEKTGGIIVEDGESVASQRSASLSGPNGKSAGTKQLPSTVREPSLDEAETDDFNTAHEEEGHEATLPLLRMSLRSAESCSPSLASSS